MRRGRGTHESASSGNVTHGVRRRRVAHLITVSTHEHRVHTYVDHLDDAASQPGATLGVHSVRAQCQHTHFLSLIQRSICRGKISSAQT